MAADQTAIQNALNIALQDPIIIADGETATAIQTAVAGALNAISGTMSDAAVQAVVAAITPADIVVMVSGTRLVGGNYLEYGNQNITLSLRVPAFAPISTNIPNFHLLMDTAVLIAEDGGSSGIADSEYIVLTFDNAVTNPRAATSIVAGGTGVAALGTGAVGSTAGSEANHFYTWTIPLDSVTTQGSINIQVANFGIWNFTGMPATVTVYAP
jgi:hypothetical protein